MINYPLLEVFLFVTKDTHPNVFVTFDIDFVDSAYAPGTGKIEVGGLTSWEALQVVGGLDGMNFVGFDWVEVLPAYDPVEITAAFGATITFEFISLIAMKNKRARTRK